MPQLLQIPVCTQMVPPHSLHVHLVFSSCRNFLMPEVLIAIRFSVTLIWYFVRYLLSSCLRLRHGKSSHSKQYFAFPSVNTLQVLILQARRVLGLQLSVALQPGHLFFALRCPLHTPQLIPQGAISKSAFNGSNFSSSGI